MDKRNQEWMDDKKEELMRQMYNTTNIEKKKSVYGMLLIWIFIGDNFKLEK